MLGRLQAELPRVMGTHPDRAMRLWIDLVYQAVARERLLVAVFRQQVPYTEQLPAVRALGPRLLEFSAQLQGEAGALVHPEFNAATLHLVNNVVVSTILQAVLDPPRDVSQKALLDELALRIEAWIRGPATRAG